MTSGSVAPNPQRPGPGALTGRTDEHAVLTNALSRAQAGEPSLVIGLAPRARTADPVALTPAEATVARLVAVGRTNREVAGELVVSVKTVETRLGRVFAKLGVRSRTELASRWMVEPGPAPHLPTTDP